MKKLRDYIKGYGYTPILLLASYTDKAGNKYHLVKEETYQTYYFLKNDEVVLREYIPGDKLQKLAIDYLNHKGDEIVNEIKEQMSYIKFLKFIKDQSGDDVDINVLK